VTIHPHYQHRPEITGGSGSGAIGAARSGRIVRSGPIGEGVKQVVDRQLVLDVKPRSLGAVRLLVQILLNGARQPPAAGERVLRRG
jgi:hypothetical protein